MRRHYNSGRDRSDKSGAAHRNPAGWVAVAEGHLPLRFAYSDGTEQREVVLERTEVRLRRVLEARMTMTMTVPTDHYLGVAMRKGWDGQAPVLVHEDPSLSLPLPTLYGVPLDAQAEAWAEALGLVCLAARRRPSPRRTGSPLTRRCARKTGRRRYVRPQETKPVAGLELCAPG